MNLYNLLQTIGTEYPAAKQETFAGHKLGSIVRSGAKSIIRPFIKNEDFVIKGSVGQGGWADIPWIVIYDKSVTDGPQDGIYIDYLFSNDGESVYLCLGIGTQNPIKELGRVKARDRFDQIKAYFRSNYRLESFKKTDDIYLADKGLGADYQDATIYYKQYKISELPTNEVLIDDLQRLLVFYEEILQQENFEFSNTDFSTSEEGVEEGKKRLKEHYVRERNKGLILRAKKETLNKTGELRCEVCQFSFSERYPAYGDGYIEAHHKKAVSDMREEDVTKVEDLAMLCANCHRMIHRKYPFISVEELKGIANTIHKNVDS